MRKVMLGLLFTILSTPLFAADYWVYIRTYDRPEVKINDTGGRSKKGDIVQVLDASIYKQPSEIEKKEWLILKVSNLTETQRNLMMTSWTEDVISTGEAERTLTTAEWTEMQKTGNYYPFTGKPVDVTAEYEAKGNTFTDKVQVKGIATTITQKTKAYRQYKLDVDTLKSLANIKIDTGLYDVKIPTGTIIPKIAAKTALDIASYTVGAVRYALITRPLLMTSNVITRRAWATTTNTYTVIPAGGGDYATTSAWEDARDGDIVTADTIEVANCSGATADTTEVVISGWTTGVNNGIFITGDYDPSGTVLRQNATDYLMQSAAHFNHCITVNNEYVTISNIQFYMNGKASCAIRTNAANCIIKNCLAAGPTGAAGDALFLAYNPSNTIFINCVAYGANKQAFWSSSTASVKFYNCVAYGCAVGFYNDWATPVAINCIANANTDNYSGTIETSYCCSDTASELSGTGDRSGTTGDVTFVNVGAGTEDFHLSNTDVNAINLGTDLSAVFTTDIDGETILTGHWPIGADYLAAAAPPAAPSGHKPRMNYFEWQLERGRTF